MQRHSRKKRERAAALVAIQKHHHMRQRNEELFAFRLSYFNVNVAQLMCAVALFHGSMYEYKYNNRFLLHMGASNNMSSSLLYRPTRDIGTTSKEFTSESSSTIWYINYLLEPVKETLTVGSILQQHTSPRRLVLVLRPFSLVPFK